MTSRGGTLVWAFVAAASLLGGAAAGARLRAARRTARLDRAASHAAIAAPSASTSSPTRPVDLTIPTGPHPRLLLTADRLARALRNRARGSAAWNNVLAACEKAISVHETSGYEGWDWGNFMTDCALVWHVTKDPRHAAGAMLYLRALVDDDATPGDGKGGDERAKHDHGYAIRTFGFYTALGFDWLYDAPGMTADFRARIVQRLDHWLDWYAKEGYKRDAPIANYFTGYFSALSFAAFATSGENPEDLVDRTERLYEDKVVPAFATLAGGDWPEGWQYGDGAAVAIAFFADAERTAKGRDVSADLPWLGDIVRHHTYALMPDGVTPYDNGDWSERPARMSARALEVLAMALPEGDVRARQARFLARSLAPARDEYPWIAPLFDEPGAATEDPRQGPTSFWARGTGLLLMRSDWSPKATVVTLQCGPSFPDADHQHADQGHVEITRGSDALLVDPGDYTSFATLNHNSILVDDGGEHLDYSPNQGGWGRDTSIRKFVDQGTYAYANCDFTDAYRPSKLEYGVPRSVTSATREIVFVRPTTLVIRDRVVTAKPSYGVTFIAHAFEKPSGGAGRLAVTRGSSRLDVITLLPENGPGDVVNEPTNTDDHPFTTNKTYAPAFRIEVPETGSVEHVFIHVLRADARESAPQPASLVRDEGAYGVTFGVGATPEVVVFADGEAAALQYTAPRAPEHLVVGLAPQKMYAVQAEVVQDGCRVHLVPGPGRAADEGGTLRMRMNDCVAQ